MEHPSLDVNTIKEMSIEEVQGKISELHRKLQIALSTQNQHVANQIYMAIETYQRAYQEMLSTAFGKGDDNGNDSYIDNIDIS